MLLHYQILQCLSKNVSANGSRNVVSKPEPITHFGQEFVWVQQQNYLLVNDKYFPNQGIEKKCIPASFLETHNKSIKQIEYSENVYIEVEWLADAYRLTFNLGDGEEIKHKIDNESKSFTIDLLNAIAFDVDEIPATLSNPYNIAIYYLDLIIVKNILKQVS